MKSIIENYNHNLINAFSMPAMGMVPILGEALKQAWQNKKTVFICGNGGSAGNAIHLANDFNYGISKIDGIGLKVDALPANQSIITCIANDEGYEHVYSQQLKVRANQDDILIVFSGSGNSSNVIKALETGNAIGMKTFAVLGFSGGRCKEIAQVPIHFPIDDMQISEDLQIIIGHICMQWLSQTPNSVSNAQ